MKELSLNLSFVPFSCAINYTSTATPDSILSGFQPSKFNVGGVGTCSDSNYCSFLTIDNLSLEQSTGISAHLANSFSAFPNPVGKTLFVTLMKPCKLMLMDVMGNVVLQKSANAVATLDVSALSNGIYFLRATGEHLDEVIRVEKQ